MPEKTILNAMKTLGNEEHRRGIDSNYDKNTQSDNNYQNERKESKQYHRRHEHKNNRSKNHTERMQGTREPTGKTIGMVTNRGDGISNKSGKSPLKKIIRPK